MAEDHRLARRGHDVQAAVPVGVRAIHQHTGGIDGVDDLVA
jgi:hypothetical protein